jgi:glycosyltransferase involved in cell wall biosynthesis
MARNSLVSEKLQVNELPTSIDIQISVIVAVSERYDGVYELYYAYKGELDKYGCAYEFVYVLDGDLPEVLEQLISLQDEGEPIKIIKFAIEFGFSAALTAGFENSSGDIILILPAFNQVQPAEISKVLEKLQDHDMVVGRRWPRSDSLFNRLQTRAFVGLTNVIIGSSLGDLHCAVKAFRRKVIQEVSIYSDQHRFLPVLAMRRGFSVKEIDVAQSSKDDGRHLYSPTVYLSRLLDIFSIFFLLKFTKKPLRFFGLIGTATFTVGALYLFYLVFERLFWSVPLAERPAMLLSSLLIVLGVQIFALGLIGELIIFTHARELKEYTIDEIVN